MLRHFCIESPYVQCGSYDSDLTTLSTNIVQEIKEEKDMLKQPLPPFKMTLMFSYN
jgi:hypothetical protein